MGFGSSKSQSQNQSQQTSASLNQAYPFLQGALGDQVGYTGKANNAIADLLGLNGAGAQNTGFDNYKSSSNYDFIKKEGINGVTSGAASKSVLNSGSALKAISNYSSNLAGNFLNSYLSQLMGLSDQGIKSAQVLSGAGNTASSQGTSAGTSTAKSTNFSLG